MRLLVILMLISSISALQIQISPNSFVGKAKMSHSRVQKILKFFLANEFYEVLARMLAFRSVDLRAVYETSFKPSEYRKII
jgi:uncharacterized membrane protein (DUF373 family)